MRPCGAAFAISMSGPPTDVSASELWQKLSEPRPSELVDFPRKDKNGKWIGKMRIQVLRMEDHDIARLRAHDVLKKKAALVGIDKLDAVDMSSHVMQVVIGDLTARELLVMACCHQNPAPGSTDENPFYPQLFANSSQLSDKLGADEVAALFTAYQLVQHKFGPFERTIQSKEDLDAWVARLAEDIDDPLVIARMPLPLLAEVSTSLSDRVFSISRLLRSQWQSLPPTLASDLEKYCLDTSFFGEPLSESDDTGSDRSPERSDDEDDAGEAPIGIPANRTIDMSEAARLAEQLRNASE